MEGVLEAEAVRDFVEHGVLEERIEAQMRLLVCCDQGLADRQHDGVELRLHHVFQLQTARAGLELHFFVVRQIDGDGLGTDIRSEEHTSELQSIMRISYAVFCLKTKILAIKNTYNST